MPEPAGRLNAKQQRFVEEYLLDLNAAAAARRAGYSERTADRIGYENLRKPEIQTAIQAAMQERSQETGITAARVLKELARIAFIDSRALFTWGPDGVTLKPSSELSEDAAAAVAEVSQTITTGGGSIKLKLHSKLPAIEMLGRHLAMWTDRKPEGGAGIEVAEELVSVPRRSPRRLRVTIGLHQAQMQFRHSEAPIRGLIGGIGSGKSWVGAYDIMRRAKPGCLYMVVAPTYKVLSDNTLRSLLKVGKDLHYIRRFNRGQGDMMIVLGNGAELLLRSTKDPDHLRGPNLSGVWMDEASLNSEAAFNVLLGRLREGGADGWLTATFTPKGRKNWTVKVFGDPKKPGSGMPDTALFHTRTAANPFLPPKFESRVRSFYTSAYAAQELDAEITSETGKLFHREWFKILDCTPLDLSAVRFWDLAATEAEDADDPDWTAGVLLGRPPAGQVYVPDVRRVRGTPALVEDLIRQTARVDSPRVRVRLEQEPGSAGKALCDHYVRTVLPGYDVRGIPSTGDKVTRAMPFAAQAEAGNVYLVDGNWVKDYLDELEQFPSDDAHDDQVDASAGAYAELVGVPLTHDYGTPAEADLSPFAAPPPGVF